MLPDTFRHDGRGPVLRCAHFSAPLRLVAVDRDVPESAAGAGQNIHILFLGLQAFCITPEEVGNSTWHCLMGDDTGTYAAFEVLRSPWLASLGPEHLARCHHFVFVFYDEYLDVICEPVEARAGEYRRQPVV